MLQKIKQQINNIDQALTWIRQHKPDHYGQRFFQLVSERCKLRNMAEAETENPAIAAYGESQKGKSYVMSNLLQHGRLPFKVKAGGKEYNFIEQINPPTVNTEATGVVTRFSAFKRNPQKYRADYPVYIKLLGPADIAAILVDGYFNDVNDYQTFDSEEIKAIGLEIYNTYKDREEVQTLLIEDDILELREYLRKYLEAPTRMLWNSNYFTLVAQVVRRVPASEWSKIFAPLWYNNDALTALFLRLLDALAGLDYAREAWLPIEAVLNDRGTIMAVKCLKGLKGEFDQNDERYTEVAYLGRNGELQRLPQMEKAVVSALCKETVFKIEDDYLKAELEYDFTKISPDVKSRLTQGTVVKDILADNDLMDFPGACPRLTLEARRITEDIDSIVKRGKVAFLFNKYCETLSVNILLYCHDYSDLKVSLMYRILAEWIDAYVGHTPEQRAKRITDMGGVAPFFVIATKFNVDLAYKTNSALNAPDKLYKRWDERFVTVLRDMCFQAKPDTWFGNWTAPGVTFKNCYLLRDYKYSGTQGDGNRLYEGYTPEGGKESRCLIEDIVVDGQHVNFYARLRDSFVNSASVKSLFADPAKSWEVAASLNNDGSLYIIEQLAIVARRMDTARDQLFADKLSEVKRAVTALMKDYYHDDDAEKIFEDNLRKANRVGRELDFTFNADSYYFGHLIAALQITEKEVYQLVHDLVASGRLTEETHNPNKDYEVILKSCGERLKSCTTDDERWQCLINTYGFIDKAEAKDYLASHGVDVAKLFSPPTKRKTNSVYIADAVLEMWKNKLTSPELVGTLTADVLFSPIVMTGLLERIALTADTLHLDEKIEQAIAPYVNVVVGTINASFIADIIASLINDFVGDLGFGSRSAEEVETLRSLAQSRALPLFRYIGKSRKETYTESELSALFDDMSAGVNVITPGVEQGFFEWKECVLIAYVAGNQVPNYDQAANDELKALLQELA